MAFSNGLAAGLQQGFNMGNAINGRRDKEARQVIEDERYGIQQKRQQTQDAAQAKTRGLQNQVAQTAIDDNKYKKNVTTAADLIRDFHKNGNVAFTNMFNDSDNGKAIMDNFGYSKIKVEKVGDSYHLLGEKDGKYGLLQQDGSLAGDEDTPMTLTGAGIVSVGKYVMGIDNKTFIAANNLVNGERDAARLKAQDRADKRKDYATKQRERADKKSSEKADVVTLNNGKKTKKSELRAQYKTYQEGEDGTQSFEEWANARVIPSDKFEIIKSLVTDEDAQAYANDRYEKEASTFLADSYEFGMSEAEIKAKWAAEYLAEQNGTPLQPPETEPKAAVTKSGRNATRNTASTENKTNFSNLWADQ